MTETNTSTKEKTKIARPKKYKVILADKGEARVLIGKTAFIKDILLVCFNLDARTAVHLTKEIEKNKKIIVGVYSKQIAKTMVDAANERCNQPNNSSFGLSAHMEVE